MAGEMLELSASEVEGVVVSEVIVGDHEPSPERGREEQRVRNRQRARRMPLQGWEQDDGSDGDSDGERQRIETEP